MAYSELIKSFSRIREYMRDFYIYGFKHRYEYDTKSARSYDNERRRIESWLGEHMSFRQDPNGKRVFISIDSRDILHNPLYKAFKAKGFTPYDILLNFYILDVLHDGASYCTSDFIEIFNNEYLSMFDSDITFDSSTLRIKLKEYEELGILMSERQGNRTYYRITADELCIDDWYDALSFFSEENPLGVVGSYLLDKLDDNSSHFRFKHHYILHALESEILYELLLGIDEKRTIKVNIFHSRFNNSSEQTLSPLHILISTQTGRQYLLAFSHYRRRLQLYRLDSIKTVRLLQVDEQYDIYKSQSVEFMKHLWGVSSSNFRNLEHIEMTVYANNYEEHILSRLLREKRCGFVESIGDGLYRFTADVYDTSEMLPWLRTFKGRIVSLECSNQVVKEMFVEDLSAMLEVYNGGESNAVS